MIDAWNPRYVAYARAHGKSPEDMLEADRLAYPGGRMTGFMLWVQSKLGPFAAAHPEAMLGSAVMNQGAWDAWLNEKADREAAALG